MMKQNIQTFFLCVAALIFAAQAGNDTKTGPFAESYNSEIELGWWTKSKTDPEGIYRITFRYQNIRPQVMDLSEISESKLILVLKVDRFEKYENTRISGPNIYREDQKYDKDAVEEICQTYNTSPGGFSKIIEGETFWTPTKEEVIESIHKSDTADVTVPLRPEVGTRVNLNCSTEEFKIVLNFIFSNLRGRKITKDTTVLGPYPMFQYTDDYQFETKSYSDAAASRRWKEGEPAPSIITSSQL